MTNEKRYELICELMRSYDRIENGDERLAERLIRNPFDEVGKLHEFWGPASELLIDALAGISEQSTPKTVAAAVKRMLAKTDTRPALQYMHKIEFRGETRYAVCDGYRALALKHDIECLPHPTEPDPTFIDLNRAMDLEKNEEINLPTVKDLKATIAAHPELKLTKKTPGQPAVLDNKIGVNALYLLDMLQALPGCRAWMTGRNGAGAPYAPIYFEAETGDGILCPVRLKETNGGIRL